MGQSNCPLDPTSGQPPPDALPGESGMPVPIQEGTALNPLDRLPPSNNNGNDTGTNPAQDDVERLCKTWSEVGRAILMRRQKVHEDNQPD